MTRWHACFLLGCVLLPRSSVAADSPQTTVDVQGRQFSAFVKQGVALAVPAAANAVLVRDSGYKPPDCALLDYVFTGSDSRIEWCKQPANAGTSNCQQLRNVVNLARFDPGTIGVTGLPQLWAIDPSAPSGGPSAEEIRQAVAKAVHFTVDLVHYRDTVRPDGVPSQTTLIIAPQGTSWATKLNGLVDLTVGQNGGPSVTYDKGARKLVTNDHVLACGLAAGDVRILWRQNADATLQASLPGPFTKAELWKVYQTVSESVASDEEDPIRRAVEVGARIGAALQKHNLADASQLDRRTHFMVNGFFRGDALQFEPNLSRTEVERRAVGTMDLDFDLDMNWSSVSARL